MTGIPLESLVASNEIKRKKESRHFPDIYVNVTTLREKAGHIERFTEPKEERERESKGKRQKVV